MTLEDVLECMLGSQIVDEHDRVEDLRAHARERSQRLGADGDADGGADKAPEDPA